MALTPIGIIRTIRSLARRVVAIDERSVESAASLADLAKHSGRTEGRLTALEEELKQLSATLARQQRLSDQRAESLDAAGAHVRQELARASADLHLLTRRSALKRSRLRVVLLVHNANAWESLSELHALMLAEPTLEPLVITLPHHFGGYGAADGEERVHAMLSSRGVAHLRCHPGQDPAAMLYALEPDVVFRQSQWDADIHSGLAADRVDAFRTCLVPYEMLNLIHNAPSAGTRNSAVDLELHRRAWLVFGPQALSDAAARDGVLGARKFRAVGHPKLDALLAAQPAWPVPDDSGRPRILFSSHHSVSPRWNRFGLLDQVAPELLAWAGEGDATFTWSPHPFLIPFVASGRATMSADALASWRMAWDALPDTATYLDPDYASVLAAADIVLTDGLSMLHEAQVLGRPVVFLERSDHLPFNESGHRVLDGVHRVSTLAQAREVVARILAEGDELAEQQRAVVTDLFGEPGAARRILEALLDQARSEGWSPGPG